jgi:beta-glucosidase
VLPIAKSVGRVALIGPFAGGQAHLNGPWVLFGSAEHAVSIEDGIRAALGSEARVHVVMGCEPEAPIPDGIEQAVAAARDSDLIVLCVGETEGMSGEAQSRAEIVIPAPQRALAEAVAAVGKPVVTILKHGRALVLDGAIAGSDALIASWFLGTETGNALADILFGDHGPSGRLPVSFPHASGQSPYFYDHRSTGRPTVTHEQGEEFKTRYREFLNSAAYPFGHGLTYGEIVYEQLELGSDTLSWSGSLEVRVKLLNRGDREAVELVQLYIRDRAASVTRPVRELKAFRHVTLAPGKTGHVVFTLRREDLLFVGRDMEWTVEPGLFDLWIAPNAEAGLHATFELLGA